MNSKKFMCFCIIVVVILDIGNIIAIFTPDGSFLNLASALVCTVAIIMAFFNWLEDH